MKCIEVYQFLIDELDEHLDDPSRESIKMHLRECHDCSTMLETLKKTVHLYKSQPELIVPESLAAHVLQAIQQSSSMSSKDGVQ
jgi:predicted anti-sigma-YlaC factor YlaD